MATKDEQKAPAPAEDRRPVEAKEPEQKSPVQFTDWAMF